MAEGNGAPVITLEDVNELDRVALLALAEGDALAGAPLPVLLAVLRRLAREAEAVMVEAAERAAVRGHGGVGDFLSRMCRAT